MAEKRGLAKLIKRPLILLAKMGALLFAVWAAYMYLVHIRYHGSVENVSIQSGDITLGGWFVKPDGVAPGQI